MELQEMLFSLQHRAHVVYVRFHGGVLHVVIIVDDVLQLPENRAGWCLSSAPCKGLGGETGANGGRN